MLFVETPHRTPVSADVPGLTSSPGDLRPLIRPPVAAPLPAPSRVTWTGVRLFVAAVRQPCSPNDDNQTKNMELLTRTNSLPHTSTRKHTKLFDVDRDGLLSEAEVAQMLEQLAAYHAHRANAGTGGSGAGGAAGPSQHQHNRGQHRYGARTGFGFFVWYSMCTNANLCVFFLLLRKQKKNACGGLAARVLNTHESLRPATTQAHNTPV